MWFFWLVGAAIGMAFGLSWVVLLAGLGFCVLLDLALEASK